jgi:gliding motility-associated-like protein
MPLRYLFAQFALFLFFLLITANSFLFAQAPAMEWQKCYGSNDGEDASHIQPTSDGGYIIVGTAYGADNDDVTGHHGNATVGDIWVVKIDRSGNIQWQKCLGGGDSEAGASVLQTADGGYIVVGSAASGNCNLTGNHGSFDFWVVRLSNKGEIIWQKMYGGSKEDYARSLAIASDGGYFIAGHTLSNDGDVKGNHGSTDWWVIKIDKTGKLLWQKCLGGSGSDQANSVQSTIDGGCIIAGLEESNDGDVKDNHGIGDYWLVKLDKAGNTQWQKTYGGTGLDAAWYVSVTNDGGYIVAGYSGSYDGDVTGKRPSGPGDSDIWILKVDNTGNIQWKKCYGGTGNDYAYFIQPTSDGGYVVAGSSSSYNYDLTCNSGNIDAWAFKINNAGDLQWQKTFGGNSADEIRCIQPLNDGSFIAVGNTSSHNIEGFHQPVPGKYVVGVTDYWVIKLSAPQNSVPPPVIVLTPSSKLVCSNNLTAIRANVTFAGLDPTYQWTRNGLSVGTNSPVYSASDFQDNDLIACTVISGGPLCNNSGLQTTQSLTIHTNKNILKPSIRITTDNNFACDCVTNNFNATVTNGGTSSVFQWQINGQNTGANSPDFSANTLKAGDVIACVYSDNTSCVAGGSVISNNIQINDPSSNASSVTITASEDSICAGSTVTFNAVPVNGGADPVYQWSVNNTIVGDHSPTFSSKNLSDGDQVSCLLTIINPCLSLSVTSNILSMTVSSPLIQITPQDTMINVGGQLQLNGIISGNIHSFQWTPADKLENPTSLSPTTISLIDNTTYTLTAANTDGCIASKSVIVKIRKPFYMPDAFTPNGDGKNDVFRIPIGISLNLKEFSIYNQWGTKVFSTENMGKGWDGTINGNPQATGVYVYIINGANENGNIFLKGTFILIR